MTTGTTSVDAAANPVLRTGAVGEGKLLEGNSGTEGGRHSHDGVGEPQLDALAAGDLVAVAGGGVDPGGEVAALLGGQGAVEGSEVHSSTEQYPKVINNAIPAGVSQVCTQRYTMQAAMTTDALKNEQLLLMEIRDKLCDGNAAELARRIGKNPTYINRLYYPEGKAGHKGIGLEIMRACNAAFFLPQGFWDRTYPALDDATAAALRQRIAKRDINLQYNAMRGSHAFRGATPPLPGRDAEPDDAMPRIAEPRPAYGMGPILAWQYEDELPAGEYVMVPRLDVHLSAGNGAGSTQVEIQFDEAQPQAFRADWIRNQRLKPRKLAAMTARGDSMEPTIFDGDSLLIDTSQTEVIDKKVYALWYDGGERVKRLFRLPGGGLRIKSDNGEYETIELSPDHVGHVRVIGRVVHRSGTGGL